MGMPAAKPFSKSHLFQSCTPVRGQGRHTVRDSSLRLPESSDLLKITQQEQGRGESPMYVF